MGGMVEACWKASWKASQKKASKTAKKTTKGGFQWMPTGTYTCPRDRRIATVAECQAAFNVVKAKIGISHKRSMQVGKWQGVPFGCSIQVGLPGDRYYHDYSPHWNTKVNTNNARAATGEFRIICKASTSSKKKSLWY